MKLYPCQLEDVEIGHRVYGFGYYGTGFFTSICVMFAEFFGKSSTRYEKKMAAAVKRADLMMCNMAEKDCDGIMCVSYQVVGTTTQVSGITFKYKSKSSKEDIDNLPLKEVEVESPKEEKVAKKQIKKSKNGFDVGADVELLEDTRVSEVDPTIIPAGSICRVKSIENNNCEISLSFNGRFIILTVDKSKLK